MLARQPCAFLVIALPQAHGAAAYPVNGREVIPRIGVAPFAYGDDVVGRVGPAVPAPYADV